MKNTKISYLYRDASNYKKHNEAVVEGVITQEQIDTIMECLNEGEYFIPKQVGLPEVRFDRLTVDDHCWFELDRDCFTATNERADVHMDAATLVEKFLEASGNWDDSEVFCEESEDEEEE